MLSVPSFERSKETKLPPVETGTRTKEIVAPPSSEAPKVIDLMEALKRSLDEAQKKAELKPARRKMAASGRRPAAQGKKKSG